MSRETARRTIPATGLVFAWLAFALLATAGAARAGEPLRARYAPGADALFWWVQISDTHIGAGWPNNADQSLAWFLDEARPLLAPLFVVVTGDLTDSAYFLGQSDGQWEQYRDMVFGAGATGETWYDVPGNHDEYSDGELAHFLTYGVQGSLFGRTQSSWGYTFPFGRYHFLTANTAGDDGAIFPIDSAGLNDEELTFLAEELDAWRDADLTFIFGHHPVSNFDDGEDAFRDLLRDFRVSLYGFGHIHSYTQEFENGTLHLSADSLGKAGNDNVVVWAVDHDVLSAAVVDQESWPVIVITAPADAALGEENPYAPAVPAAWPDNPVRALVFGPAPIDRVRARLDEGPWSTLAPARDHVWEGTFSTESTPPGTHDLTVEVLMGTTTTRTIEIVVDDVPPVVVEPGADVAQGVAEPGPDVVQPAPDAVAPADDAGGAPDDAGGAAQDAGGAAEDAGGTAEDAGPAADAPGGPDSAAPADTAPAPGPDAGPAPDPGTAAEAKGGPDHASEPGADGIVLRDAGDDAGVARGGSGSSNGCTATPAAPAAPAAPLALALALLTLLVLALRTPRTSPGARRMP